MGRRAERVWGEVRSQAPLTQTHAVLLLPGKVQAHTRVRTPTGPRLSPQPLTALAPGPLGLPWLDTLFLRLLHWLLLPTHGYSTKLWPEPPFSSWGSPPTAVAFSSPPGTRRPHRPLILTVLSPSPWPGPCAPCLSKPPPRGAGWGSQCHLTASIHLPALICQF